jgi:alkylhydroperoxidase family enzyme
MDMGETGHGQRLPLLNLDELDEDLRVMADKWAELGGDPNFIRAFAHAPDFLKRFVAFYSPLVRKGRVPHRIKELVRIRLAHLNDCHY